MGALYENMVGIALIKQGYKLVLLQKKVSHWEADFFDPFNRILNSLLEAKGEKWAGKINENIDYL